MKQCGSDLIANGRKRKNPIFTPFTERHTKVEGHCHFSSFCFLHTLVQTFLQTTHSFIYKLFTERWRRVTVGCPRTEVVSLCVCLCQKRCSFVGFFFFAKGKRDCSPPTRLIERAGPRPRLFQPQLIECICTQLHNDCWVSLQLVSLVKISQKLASCFLTVCLFPSSFISHDFEKYLYLFKIGKDKGSCQFCLVLEAFISLGSRGGRKKGRNHLADNVQFVFHIFWQPCFLWAMKRAPNTAAI